MLDEAAAPDAAALADRAGRAIVVVVATRIAIAGCATPPSVLAAADAVVVELGLPVWRPDGARGYVGDATAAAASSYEALADRLLERCSRSAGVTTRPGSSSSSASSRRRSRGCSSGRARTRRSSARCFRRARRPLPPDRLARQLVERGALRAVPARPGEPRPGRVRDAVALHALRAAAAPRRRARDRHLAVGRVARRAGGDRRGPPSGPADDRDHEPARVADRRARPRRCCRSRRARSSPSPRRRPTSTRSARSRCSSRRRRATRDALRELDADARPDRGPARALVRRTPPRSTAYARHPRRHGRRARDQLRDVVRDRAEDPRALRACSSRPTRPPT